MSYHAAFEVLRAAEEEIGVPPLQMQLDAARKRQLRIRMRDVKYPELALLYDSVERGEPPYQNLVAQLKRAIQARGVTPGDSTGSESWWKENVKGKQAVHRDWPMFFAIWNASFKADARFLKESGMIPESKAVEADRHLFLALVAERTLLLDISILHDNMVQIRLQNQLFLNVLPVIRRKLDELLMMRIYSRRPVLPIVVPNWCRGHSHGKGCKKDGGRAKCELRHGCHLCYTYTEADWTTHGDADCGRQSNLFGAGKGRGYTIDIDPKSSRQRTRGYGDRSGGYNNDYRNDWNNGYGRGGARGRGGGRGRFGRDDRGRDGGRSRRRRY